MIAPLVLYAAAQIPQPHWRWPVDVPVVTRPLDPPTSAYGPGHRGVDLADPVGTAILAPAAGVVSYAGPLAGRGVVVVTSGPYRSTFEPLRPAVHVGQHVATGSLLGWLQSGHPGCPQPACVHWGVLQGATYLNPLAFVLGSVRLLPHLSDDGRQPTASRVSSATTSFTGRRTPANRGGKHNRALGALAGAAAGGTFAVLRRRRLLQS